MTELMYRQIHVIQKASLHRIDRDRAEIKDEEQGKYEL
jgi:hypothetical protein